MNALTKTIAGTLRNIGLRVDQAADRILGIGYDAGETSRYRKDLGWGRLTPRDEDSMVAGDRTREWIRLKGSDLRRNNPVIAGMCERLGIFFSGCGITPEPRTKDEGWNTAARQFWQGYSETCDVRGRLMMDEIQALIFDSRPTQGGLYFELLDNGQIRPIECERIRQPTNPKDHPGYVDGVKTDKSGKVSGYWVHSRDSDGSFTGAHDEGFIPSQNILPVIRRPMRADQVREIPDLAEIIPVMSDLHEMNTYHLNTAKVRSQIIGALKKQNGMGPNMQPRNASTPAVGQRQTWRMDWGQMMELFTNEDIVFPSTNMPDPQHIPYMKLQLLLAASKMNLPYEFFTLDFSTADFSRMKAVLTIVNRVRRNWVHWQKQRFLQPLWNWRIAKEMGPRGQLSPAPTDARGISQWNIVNWQADEELGVDRAEANTADVLEYQMCLGTLGEAANRRGHDIYSLADRKLAEMAALKKKAEAAGFTYEQLVSTNLPGSAATSAQPGAQPKGKNEQP